MENENHNKNPKPRNPYDTLAIGSLVLSIMSFYFLCTPYLSIIASVIALVMGIIIWKKRNEQKKTKQTALATIIISSATILTAIFMLIGFKFVANNIVDKYVKDFEQYDSIDNHYKNSIDSISNWYEETIEE